MNKTKKTHPDITSKHDIPSSILDKQCINNSDTNIEWGKKKKKKKMEADSIRWIDQFLMTNQDLDSTFPPCLRSIDDTLSQIEKDTFAISLTIQYRSSAHRHAYSRIKYTPNYYTCIILGEQQRFLDPFSSKTVYPSPSYHWFTQFLYTVFKKRQIK